MRPALIAILAGIAPVAASCSSGRHDHAAEEPAERWFVALGRQDAEDIAYRQLTSYGYGDYKYKIERMSLKDGVWYVLALPDTPDIPIGSQLYVKVYPNRDCDVRGGH